MVLMAGRPLISQSCTFKCGENSLFFGGLASKQHAKCILTIGASWSVQTRPDFKPLSFRSFCHKAVDVVVVGCLTSQLHASVSQGRICSDNFTCCHTDKEVADQTFHLTQSQYADTGPTNPSDDPITPGA